MCKHNEAIYKEELLDLYRRVDNVLTAAKIRHFALFGTCIGAMRNGGIIPWDDDIDLAVMRDDLDRAIHILDQSREGLFADYSSQGQVKMARYGRVFNRIASTDRIERKRAYVDIFVLDYVPDSRLVFKAVGVVYVGIRRILERRRGYRDINRHPLHYFIVDTLTMPFRLFPTSCLIWMLNRLYASRKPTGHLKIGSFKRRYPAHWFADVKRVPFDGLTMPVPVGYDEYLTEYFGDWRTPPPVEQQHGNAFDADGHWSVELPDDALRLI